MRFASRLVCALVGHRPEGGRATYDAASESFVDVAKTQYAVCTRCGDVRPAPLDIVEKADVADEVEEPNEADEADEVDGANKTDETEETGAGSEADEDAVDGVESESTEAARTRGSESDRAKAVADGR